jgi:ABC-type transporter Mla subunit MlaD
MDVVTAYIVQNRDAMLENFAIRDRATIADLRAQNEQLRAAFRQFAAIHKDMNATAQQVNDAWEKAERAFETLK